MRARKRTLYDPIANQTHYLVLLNTAAMRTAGVTVARQRPQVAGRSPGEKLHASAEAAKTFLGGNKRKKASADLTDDADWKMVNNPLSTSRFKCASRFFRRQFFLSAPIASPICSWMPPVWRTTRTCRGEKYMIVPRPPFASQLSGAIVF